MLFIFGEKDNYIPVEVANKMLQLNSAITVQWLSNSGHMGFVEEQETSIGFLLNFCC
jgi:pimeloyl-ACP methyl ester carboxylesterase